MCLFILQNATICVLFAISFLVEGIFNAIYAADNGDLHSDLCFGFETGEVEFCDDLKHVVAAEAASAVS